MTTNQLENQIWVRDTDEPCLRLGEPGRFDDTHIFAPCVMYEDGRYLMWYCGSRNDVERRVFNLGLAESDDGKAFTRRTASVLSFGDNRSILTPCLLRGENGEVLRKNGRLRMWFSATDFPKNDGIHTLHEATSADGVVWNDPSLAQLDNIYAPSILLDGTVYRMWYTDVGSDPWCFRYAESDDGVSWRVHEEPVLTLGQEWETGRLFYPYVAKTGGSFVMWYGAYRSNRTTLETALGMAVSDDGVFWQKSEKNPVFEPDKTRDWETHFTTSESVLQLPDGTWRMWYATRPAPPFVHKYYAIGTAVLRSG